MSVRGINKVKRELGFVLMALNIRKIAAQRAVHYKIHIKKACLLYTSPSPRDMRRSRMPSSA
ncbi:hypothetical protein JMUB7527_13770 [Staphylococcus aureus]